MPPVSPKPLAPHEAHIWQTALTTMPDVLRQWQQVLSPEEQTRAVRFKFDRDRQRYEIAHGVLRHVLAGYAHCAPSGLRFEINAYGKPHVAGSTHLHFNLSHSQDVAVIAIAHTDIGVDVEAVCPLDDLLHMAQQFFGADEAEALQGLPSAAQPLAFYRAWVRKEAWLKAIGTGLSNRLDSVRVRLGEQAQTGVWESLDAQFRVQELAMPAAYVCAVAAGIEVKTVSRFTVEH